MGLLVTVLGTHAGVGTTTVALNLAAALADGGSRTVRLVELDDAFGHLAVDLAVQPTGDVVDAATLAAGANDTGSADPVVGMLTPLAPGLTGLLCAPRRQTGGTAAVASRLRGPATARLLDAARSGADVVVDTPAAFEDPVVTALGLSDRVVVVSSPEGPAVEALRLTLDSLALMQIPAGRVCVVLNHVASGAGFADAEALPVTSVPVTAVVTACADLEPGIALVAVDQPEHPLTRAVVQVAGVLRASARNGKGSGQPSDGGILRRLRR